MPPYSAKNRASVVAVDVHLVSNPAMALDRAGSEMLALLRQRIATPPIEDRTYGV